MNCPFCGSTQIMVTNSRPTMGGSQIWRRRKCLGCSELFTTHELIDLSHLVVIKRTGKKEKYSRAKLYTGIFISTVSSRQAERQKLVEMITRRVEREILHLKRKEIKSSKIAGIVLENLKIHSPGAFLTFLSFHKNIDRAGKIKSELKRYL